MIKQFRSNIKENSKEEFFHTFNFEQSQFNFNFKMIKEHHQLIKE